MFDWSYVILGIVTSVWFMGWVRPFHTWKQRLKQKIPTRPSKLYKYPILNFGHQLWLEGWVDWDWTSWLGGYLTFYKTGRGSYAEIQNNWVEHSTALRCLNHDRHQQVSDQTSPFTNSHRHRHSSFDVHKNLHHLFLWSTLGIGQDCKELSKTFQNYSSKMVFGYKHSSAWNFKQTWTHF